MELLEQLAAIESSGLVYALSAQAELEYMFRHALVQEAAYGSLLKQTRRALHQAVGETLERLYPERLDELTPLLAQHYAEGGDDARALHYFTRAAQIASQKYANAEAVAHYTHAIEAAERLGQWTAELRHARGHAYELVGEFESAQADYQTALDEARVRGDKRAEWQSLMDLGFLWSGRDYTQAGIFLKRAYQLAAGLDEPLTFARSLNRLGNWYLNVNRPLEALRYHEQALAIVQAREDRAGVAETLDLLAMANFQYGDVVQSAAYGERAGDMFRELGQRQGLSSSLAVRGIMGVMALVQAMSLGELSLAGGVRDSESSLSLARDIGWRSGEAFALICLGLCLAAQGNYGPALARAHEGLALAEAIAHQQWMTSAHFALGLLYDNMLAAAQARQHAERALDLAQATRSGLWLDITTGFRASLYIADNDLRQAATTLDNRQAQPNTGSDSAEPWNSGLATRRVVQLARVELALAKGRPDEALRLSDELMATAPHVERYGTGSLPRLARLRGEALSALGRFPEAESQLLAALAGAERVGARPIQWRSQHSLAGLYQAQGNQPAREEALRAARRLVAQLAESLDDDALRAEFVSRAGAGAPR